jgi:type II restriction/modification system DNA methylase subunit YeeA
VYWLFNFWWLSRKLFKNRSAIASAIACKNNQSYFTPVIYLTKRHWDCEGFIYLPLFFKEGERTITNFTLQPAKNRLINPK